MRFKRLAKASVVVALLGVTATYLSYDEQIKSKIDILKNAIITRNDRIEDLESKIAELEGTTDDYSSKIQALISEINKANAEEVGQLEYLEDVIQELNLEVEEEGGGIQGTPKPPTVLPNTSKQEAYNNLSATAKALADCGYAKGDITIGSNGNAYVIPNEYKFSDNTPFDTVLVSQTDRRLKITPKANSGLSAITQADVTALDNWASL